MKTVELSERLISLRGDRRASQQDLVEALSVLRQMVPRWEVGIVIPSMDNLLALGKLSGVPTGELMGGDKVVSVPESEKTQGSENRKGRSVLKVTLIIPVVAVLVAAIVITYLNQKDTESEEQNTVKFEGLEGERISDSDAVISGSISQGGMMRR